MAFHPSKSLIFGVLIALVVVVFAFQNNDPATLRFWKWGFEASTAVIFIFSVAIGIGVALIIAIPKHLQNQVQIMSLKNKVKKLEKELGKTSEKLDEARVEKLEIPNEPPANETL